MKVADIIVRAGRNLRQAKARTILTSLAIGVGAFTIALAMAAGMGGRAYTEEMVNTSGDTLSLSVYPKFEQTAQSDDLPEYGVVSEDGASSSQRGLTDRDIAALEKVTGVASVQPQLSIESLYTTRGGDAKKLVAPLSVKVDRTEMKLAAGTLENNMPRAGQVVIPEDFVTSFGFKDAQSAIGQPLTIRVPQMSEVGDMDDTAARDFTFMIAAVDRKSDTTLYYEKAVRISPADSKVMYTYQRGEAASQEYYGVTVLAKQGTDIATLQRTIQDKGYEVYSLQDMREALMQMISIAQWGLAGFGALAVLASIFGIINTQYISVLERTQQIGLMKALGARRRDISKLFRYEAAWIGFLGGAIGVGLAFAVTLFNPLINQALELEAGTQLLKMDWFSSVILVVVLMLVAVLSGYFPARKAAKLDPIEALRTE